MSNIKIVEATEDMCIELAKVKRQAWETTYRGIYADEKLDNYDYEEQTQKFMKYIIGDSLDLYVAIIEGKIIGYVSVGKSAHRENSNEIEIVMLYLLKKYQGKGIGKRLFEFAKERIKSKGYDSFTIHCNKYNINAQKFYEKMGGEVVYISPDNEDKSIPQIKYFYKI